MKKKPAKPPKAILDKVAQIKGKRSRVVVDHIVEHGSITTEDLENYGYKHPPRAIRDVREQGLPLDMFWTTNASGRKIAGYTFGDPNQVRHDRLGGRTVFAREFQAAVCEAHDSRCAICHGRFERRYLQLDHRVPFEVAGEAATRDLIDYMPLCGSCNRAKSWSCEHCANWTTIKDPATCRTCYWANPQKYLHIAMRPIRRLDLIWEDTEVADYDGAQEAAANQSLPLPEFVKDVIRKSTRKKGKS
jgi:hypothetical protein